MPDYTIVRRNPQDAGDFVDVWERDRRKGRDHLRDLSEGEARALVQSVKRGRVKVVKNVRLPLLQLARFMSLSGVEFDGVDAYLEFGPWLLPRTARVKQCAFRDMRATDWRANRARFEDCSFDDLRIVVFRGLVTRSSFERCRFSDCRVGELSFYNTEFHAVRFDRLRGLPRFERSRLEDVTITGSLKWAGFHRCVFVRTDLSALRLKNLYIGGLEASADVMLPQHPDCFVVRFEDLRALLAAWNRRRRRPPAKN